MKKFFVLCLILLNIFFCSSSALAAQKHWRNPAHLDTYIQPGYGRSDLMKKAFAEWSRLTKNKVVFYYVDSPKKAQIEVQFGEKILRTQNKGTAGLTKTKMLGDEMYHATILIPLQTSAGIEMSKEMVYVVMLHEIGHALGILKHSTNPQNIMYPAASSDNKKITKYDLAELYRIYGWKQDF